MILTPTNKFHFKVNKAIAETKKIQSSVELKDFSQKTVKQEGGERSKQERSHNLLECREQTKKIVRNGKRDFENKRRSRTPNRLGLRSTDDIRSVSRITKNLEQRSQGNSKLGKNDKDRRCSA